MIAAAMAAAAAPFGSGQNVRDCVVVTRTDPGKPSDGPVRHWFKVMEAFINPQFEHVLFEQLNQRL